VIKGRVIMAIVVNVWCRRIQIVDSIIIIKTIKTLENIVNIGKYSKDLPINTW